MPVTSNPPNATREPQKFSHFEPMKENFKSETKEVIKPEQKDAE
jgi:hypothetical protein